jgi:hypothetical protein
MPARRYRRLSQTAGRERPLPALLGRPAREETGRRRRMRGRRRGYLLMLSLIGITSAMTIKGR